jgi:hypothetical protein
MPDLSQATVTGPVTGGARGWAFGTPVVDLAPHGYREDEFFLEGHATRYAPVPGTELGWDGRWQVQPIETAPFKTRMVVVRPVDPAAFSGTVLMAWNNVTAGYDNFGGGDSPVLFDNGGAFVAVSAQRVGVHGFPENPMGLIGWDPERYGSLSIPSDDYSFDIFTQAAKAILGGGADGAVNPVGGLEVRRIIAQGASQSAGRLSTYLNAVQPLARTIDGFMLTLYFGSGSPLEVGKGFVSLPAPGTEEARLRPPLVGSHLLRDDLDVPVMVVNSESETESCYGVRQPDTERFRYWEAAGTAHVSRQAMASVGPRYQRDFGFVPPDQPGINEVPMNPVVDAALHHMLAWVEHGVVPPSQPRIEFTGDPPEVSRDEHGIARGGIRLPQVEVPIAHNSAIPLTPDFISRLGGSSAPFPPEKLRALYESRTSYLKRFEEAARAAESTGAILPVDADALIAEAAGSTQPDL